MKWLLNKAVLDEIRHRLNPQNRMLLFLNYDSVLNPGAAGEAVQPLDLAMREQLRELSEISSLTLTVVSDYSLAALRKFIGFSGLYLVANNGLEIFGPDLNVVHAEAKRLRQVFKEMLAALTAKQRELPEVVLENRDLSLVVHFNQAKPLIQRRARIVLEQIWTPVMDAVTLQEKNNMLILRPRLGWGKGRAVMFLWNKFATPRRRPLVMALGADETDEEIFGFMGREGMGVIIGGESRVAHSKAGYFLKNRAEVLKFSSWLADNLPHPNHSGSR
ncbi:MAG: trehalose-phosphatase [Candidatus Firestonebacteria bacterium]|nr:trehalose-phosphatase [Candidatus Firestonebacteria bacterium]